MKNLHRVLTIAAIFSVVPLSAAEQTVIGKTVLAVGNVQAINDEDKRKLRRRSPVFEIDAIATGKGSKAQFSMVDGGLITLKEDSLLEISQYNVGQGAEANSAALELVRGGLRSISGSIKKNGGDYKVNTPVGTIGIRGTHFQVELVGEDVVFAVWDGNIDVELENSELLSLGVNEDFAYAKINSQGVVTPLLQAPAGITVGYSSDGLSAAIDDDEEASDDEQQTADDAGSEANTEGSTAEQTTAQASSDSEETTAESETTTNESDTLNDGIAQTSTTGGNDAVAEADTNIDTSVDSTIDTTEVGAVSEITSDDVVDNTLLQEEKWQGVDDTPLAELISNRQGSVSYNQVSDFNVTSTAGAVENFAMEMVVNFDNGSIPNGFISYDDPEGNWYATYAGLINGENLELDVTFASHGDAAADGDISAGFFNGLEEIIGSFELHELEDEEKKSGGSFVIKP